MRTIKEIVEDIKQLSPQDRLRLVTELEALSPDDTLATETVQTAALDAFLALAGTAVSDHTDVASDKLKHLAEIYSDNHGPA